MITTNGHTGAHHPTNAQIDSLYAWVAPMTPAPPPLPEAPASVNVRIQIGGREVQWTLRDSDEARLATRLDALLARYPLPQPQAPPAPGPSQGQSQDWCPIHNVALHLNHGKDGRTWYSHKLPEGGFCKGK
jgi:hypothetical protein